MKKSRLAIIGIRGIPANFPGSSGIDTYVENQLPTLTKKYSIILFSRSWAKTKSALYREIAVPCLKHLYLDTGLYTLFVTFFAIFQNPDIYNYHAPGSALFSFIPKLMGKKVILTLHGIEWQRNKWSNIFTKTTIHLLEILAIYSSNEIHVVSKDLKDYVNERYHRQAVFDPPITIVTRISQTNLLKQWQVKPNQYLLYLGRLVPEKRADWLITAFEKYSNSKSLKLVIAGYIDHSDYCQKLLSRANPDIVFTNYVTGATKWQLLTHCRLFILPSSLEGNSLALNEALALHKNCLVSDISPHHHLNLSTGNKLNLFRSDSFQDFSKQLAKCLLL